jgi:hypothetical protein
MVGDIRRSPACFARSPHSFHKKDLRFGETASAINYSLGQLEWQERVEIARRCNSYLRTYRIQGIYGKGGLRT